MLRRSPTETKAGRVPRNRLNTLGKVILFLQSVQHFQKHFSITFLWTGYQDSEFLFLSLFSANILTKNSISGSVLKISWDKLSFMIFLTFLEVLALKI